MKGSSKVQFDNLDSIRTIAFLFVFSEHILWSAINDLGIENDFFQFILYNIFANGGLGVSLFFVLSGFLITYLMLKEKQLSGQFSIFNFYYRRALRIWPLYFLVLVVVFFVFPFFMNLIGNAYNNPANPIFYFTYLSNFDMIRIGHENLQGSMQSGVTWSVSIEEQFYFVWPLIFVFFKGKRFLYMLLMIVIVSIIFRFQNIGDPILVYFHSLAVCGDLAIGGLFAWLTFNFRNFRFFFRKCPREYFNYFYCCTLIWFFFIGFFINESSLSPLFRTLNTIIFAIFISDQCFGRSKINGLGKYKFLDSLGKYSYGLYLLHPMGYLMFKLSVDFLDLDISGFFLKFLSSIIIFILTFILAYLSYTYFESFFLRIKNKYSIIHR